THTNQQTNPVILKSRGDVCEAGFEFTAAPSQSLTGLLIAAPTELGLRAKNIVYRVSFLDGSAVRIGELPASAERTGNGKFLDVYQGGGSVFLDRYDVSSNLVKLSPVSLELILDGRLCIQRKNDVWNMETGSKKSCSKIATANFASPLCLVHKAGKARLSPRLACKELEDRWHTH
ncbi:MAG: hypothetical protein Q8L39_07270, partial [Burkholderiales bacterium]|nr:hypothetical protein [Burkholderiales bacterium]